MRSLRTAAVLAAAAAALVPASPVSGQIAWDTPRMVGPESPSGLGIYWLRAEVLPGDGDALLGSWGLPGTGGAVSVRG